MLIITNNFTAAYVFFPTKRHFYFTAISTILHPSNAFFGSLSTIEFTLFLVFLNNAIYIQHYLFAALTYIPPNFLEISVV